MTIEPVEASPAPDPARAITPEDLGRELSLARELAGMTVRQVAREAQVPPSTVGDYFVGRHLPAASQAEALRKIVRVCGVTDPDQVETWVEALGRVRRAPGRRPASAPAPYRGLAFFDSEDAEWFFGRDELVGRLTSCSRRCTRNRDHCHRRVWPSEVVAAPSRADAPAALRSGAR
jgi:transcriptional regulator with XRE-family HTH domain